LLYLVSRYGFVFLEGRFWLIPSRAAVDSLSWLSNFWVLSMKYSNQEKWNDTFFIHILTLNLKQFLFFQVVSVHLIAVKVFRSLYKCKALFIKAILNLLNIYPKVLCIFKRIPIPIVLWQCTSNFLILIDFIIPIWILPCSSFVHRKV